MNINHSPEYLALWKSQKRAEWAAVRLDQEAKVIAKGMGVVADRVGVMVGVSEEKGPGDGIIPEITVEQLEQESRHMWGLYSEIKAELAQVEAALTVDQRKNAAKVLKQWEREEKVRAQ